MLKEGEQLVHVHATDKQLPCSAHAGLDRVSGAERAEFTVRCAVLQVLPPPFPLCPSQPQRLGAVLGTTRKRPGLAEKDRSNDRKKQKARLDSHSLRGEAGAVAGPGERQASLGAAGRFAGPEAGRAGELLAATPYRRGWESIQMALLHIKRRRS